MAVWAEIDGPFAVDMARLEDAWQVFFCYGYAGIAFAIFEEDVIAWLELFDELIFEEERFCFCLDNGVMDVVDLGHEDGCLA